MRSLTAVAMWCCGLSAGCAPRDAAPHHSYLYVFAGGEAPRSASKDFLAVIDAEPSSPSYATIVATTPIDTGGTMPHHMELTMPPDGRWLFANGFMSGRIFLFDLADPLRPRLAATVDSVTGLRMPHSFWRLKNGQVVATLQHGNGSEPGDPGGLALLTPEGQVVRTTSARDSTIPAQPIRTYSLDVSEATDRLLTTSNPMVSEPSADVVQVWRLSDLHLLHSLPMPSIPGDSTTRHPFELRYLPGDSTAVLNTWNCGIFLLSGLTSSSPRIEHLLSLPQPRYWGCGVPLVFGHHWILPAASAHEYVVFDIRDPRHPTQVGALSTDSTWYPHWITREPSTNRLVLTSGWTDRRVLLARFDSVAGVMSWDSTFREPGGKRLGVDFDRTVWPHGQAEAATPHGAVFGRKE